jgi:hypothetical protein
VSVQLAPLEVHEPDNFSSWRSSDDKPSENQLRFEGTMAS